MEDRERGVGGWWKERKEGSREEGEWKWRSKSERKREEREGENREEGKNKQFLSKRGSSKCCQERILLMISSLLREMEEMLTLFSFFSNKKLSNFSFKVLLTEKPRSRLSGSTWWVSTKSMNFFDAINHLCVCCCCWFWLGEGMALT